MAQKLLRVKKSKIAPKKDASADVGVVLVGTYKEKQLARISPTDLEKHLHLTAKEGKTKLAAVKVRVNQDIFRTMFFYVKHLLPQMFLEKQREDLLAG